MAFGVLVDVLVVRMAIVPAVMPLLGHSAWWLPRWLARVLPNVDVEGQSFHEFLNESKDTADDDGSSLVTQV
ncbi:hypothetical protein [Leekyejoonella antrihumi]|uniref:hypothetical protein n=1 Tax=Leekyejoonella antrihumi TaxID=1660198 RepID=UPI003CCC59AA